MDADEQLAQQLQREELAGAGAAPAASTTSAAAEREKQQLLHAIASTLELAARVRVAAAEARPGIYFNCTHHAKRAQGPRGTTAPRWLPFDLAMPPARCLPCRQRMRSCRPWPCR